MRRWPGRIRDAGGSRTHFDSGLQPVPRRLAPAPSHPVSSPGLEPGLDLRRVACESPTPRGPIAFSALPRNRTPSGGFEDRYAHPAHPQGRSNYPDQDSNHDLDLRRVPCDPLHHRDIQRPDLESNQGQGLRRALCDPLHHRDRHTRADDWICTSIDAVYKTAASLFGHVGNSSRSARI